MEINNRVGAENVNNYSASEVAVRANKVQTVNNKKDIPVKQLGTTGQQNNTYEADGLKKIVLNETSDTAEIEEKVKKAIETANKKMVGPNIELSFSVHKQTNRIMIKVQNQETGETIREIPSEKVLDMLADLCNVSGKVIDVKK